VEDVHYGEVGPSHLLDRVVNCGCSWCPLAHVCCVIRLFPLQGFKLAQVTTKPLNMGDTCPLQSFCRIVTSHYVV
jgi:hypothetical protein